MGRQLYSLTDDHRTQLKPWADKWIANAMSTAPMTDLDREICAKAAVELYAAAGLPAPRVVFVSSPFIGRFAAGFAAAIWYLKSHTWQATEQATWQATEQATWQATWQATRQATRQATEQATEQATRQATRQATEQATRQATEQATRQATRQATEQATWQATEQATRQATEQATWQATEQATRQATEQATWQATEQATRQATEQATRQATEQATWQATWQATRQDQWFQFPLEVMQQLSDSLGLGKFGLMCAENAGNFWQGGNQWSGYDSYISFFRHVSKLPLDYSKWEPWEILSLHSSVRFVHENFCIICDRPEILTVDENNRPHNEAGPFCRWRDGSELYSLHGVRLPAKYVLTPAEQIDASTVLSETNVEIRRELIRKIGVERFIQAAGATVLNSQGDYELLSVKLSDEIPDARYLKMLNPSIGVWHVEGVAPGISTVQKALNWRAGIENEDWQPAALT